MGTQVQIRRASPRGFDALGEVFHSSVREGAGLYSPAQRAAWSPAPRSGGARIALLSRQRVWLAEAKDGPLGFMSLTPEGCVDLAYILPNAQGQGLFRRLYGNLEAQALALGFERLTTDASLHAKTPFEAVGFSVSYSETAALGGEEFKRFRMEKALNA